MTFSEEELRERIYALNYEEWRDVCAVSRFSDRELAVEELEGGVLLPPRPRDSSAGEYSGGVCDGEFRFVAGFLREKPPKGGWFGVNESYRVEEEEIEDADEEVIYGGVLIQHFGHFILENFARTWFLLPPSDGPENIRAARRRKTEGKRVAFLVIGELKQWHVSFLELLGIPRERILIVARPTRFRSVIIPEEAVHSWYNYTKEHLLPYRYMAKKAGTPERVKDLLGRKIYLTRSGLAKTETLCCNEEYFERFFADRGFALVEPEEYSAAEQVAILSHAEEVACVMGSLSHWALFCKPGTRFTMLTRVSTDTLLSQCLVNEAAGVDWRIVDVSMNFLYANRAFGVCLIGPTFYWKEFVLDTYGSFEEDDRWKLSYHDYLIQWTDFYLTRNPERFQGVDPAVIFREMNRALCLNEFPVEYVEKRKGRPFLLCSVKSGGRWLPEVPEGRVCGGRERMPLEGMKLRFSSSFLGIRYAVFSQERGWGREVEEGEIAEILDAEGRAQPVCGIRIRLDGKGRKARLCCRFLGASAGWSKWAMFEEVIASSKVPLLAWTVQLVLEGENGS